MDLKVDTGTADEGGGGPAMIDIIAIRIQVYLAIFLIVGFIWRRLEVVVYGAPNLNWIDTFWGAVLAVSLGENLLRR